MSRTEDPAMFSSGYDRNHLDRYWTHPWMVDELVRFVGKYMPKTIWECAAGRGDMTRALQNHGRLVYSTDIDMSEFPTDLGPGHAKSFLDETAVPWCEEWDAYDSSPVYEMAAMPQRGPCQGIVTNPPYNEPWKGIGDDFIRHGLRFMSQREDGIFFMAHLMRSEFNKGKTRQDMFGDRNPHYMGELVLTTRPRWDYSDPNRKKSASPRHNFSWFIWFKDWKTTCIPHSIQMFSYMPKGFKP